MIDLHNHILPGIDDGAPDLAASLAMARAFVEDGVDVVACTPHILPGLYHNTGPQIRAAVASLQGEIDAAGLPLLLTTGADVHISPNLVDGLGSGTLLTLADSRYVLIEPPHHVAPVRFEETLFSVLLAGYVPIVTHPERLSWIREHYDVMQRLVGRGVWMQITAGSLAGKFGRNSLYWAERMLSEGLVHILASDAHDTTRRAPNLARGKELASRHVGIEEAERLVKWRPLGIVRNESPEQLTKLGGLACGVVAGQQADMNAVGVRVGYDNSGQALGVGGTVRSLGGRLRKLFQ